MTTLRRLVLAASVIALLPVGAMAASPDTSNGSSTTATTPAAPTHHKKPVHHVSHKTHKPKPTSTPTQS